MLRTRVVGAFALALTILVAGPALAQPEPSRFSAGGYMRIAARPDLQGGTSTLGFWNLYGRLLNEGPYAALDLRYDLLQRDALTLAPWTSIHARIEGGSVANADLGQGSLANFRLSQLYAETGNVLFRDVTWRIGTLESFFGDLGLYDFRPASVFFDTIGLSARYQKDWFEMLLGVGDAGYFYKGLEYNTILSVGGTLKFSLGDHIEVGTGGQYYYEPEVEGNRFAPHNSVFEDGAGIDYENWVRGEITRRFFEENPMREGIFTEPVPTSTDSFRAILYLGFGNLGPLIWNNLFANVLRRHPETRTNENWEGEEFTFYVEDLTDERYQINIGNEMQLRLWPDVLDLTWAVFYGRHFDEDNDIVVSDNDREIASIVARFQGYFTETAQLLLETSFAHEKSLNGDFIRTGADSVFQSTEGRADARGLEFGDSDTRETFQFKVGPVLQPKGMGVFNRPSFRLLYGLQWSNQNNAFGNGFVESLDDFNVFGTQENHLHHVVSLEVETWF